ncbi:unnamed protein product [Citrullus colocynthis]|uniref:Uncharacterized protein n=1 Tax=Citrullus colocynthis TaxID=252529 RepID=A0ABP0YES1_9ROSI
MANSSGLEPLAGRYFPAVRLFLLPCISEEGLASESECKSLDRSTAAESSGRNRRWLFLSFS